MDQLLKLGELGPFTLLCLALLFFAGIIFLMLKSQNAQQEQTRTVIRELTVSIREATAASVIFNRDDAERHAEDRRLADLRHEKLERLFQQRRAG
jgi:hypothetical protein